MSWGKARLRAKAGRSRSRIRAPFKVLLPALFALAAGGAVAMAAAVAPDGTITGCVLTSNNSDNGIPLGSLRVLDSTVTGDQSCTSGEEQISWNQTGRQGPAGQNGQNGLNGAPGPEGPPGPSGGGVTVQSGSPADIVMLLSPPDDLGKLKAVSTSETELNNHDSAKNQAFSISSFSLDATSTSTIGSQTGGAGAGKVHFGKFSFVKRLDKYSSALFQDLAGGKMLKSVEIIVREPSGTAQSIPVVQYLFKNVAITDLHVGAQSRSPAETVQGEYASIQFVVYEQTASGQTKVGPSGGWNQVTNQPVLVPTLTRLR
jgi:type VI protein secretion system component Hcp